MSPNSGSSRRSCLAAIALLLIQFVFAPGAGAVAAPTSLSSCQSLPTGNYVLSTNLTTSGTCFTITGSNVAVDMKGHKITGNGTGSGFTDGGSTQRNVSIVNGTITNFATGINFSNSQSRTETIDRINVSNNQGDGIFIKDCCNTLTNIKANGNQGDGVDTPNCCSTYANIQANDNTGEGVFNGGCCSLVNKISANNNHGDGIDFEECCSFVDNSVASNNGGDGIFMPGDENLVENSQANGNTDNGIEMTEGNNFVDHSVASNNGGAGYLGTCSRDIATNSMFNSNSGAGVDLTDASSGNCTGQHVVSNVTANSNHIGVHLQCPASATLVRAKDNAGGNNLVEVGGTCTNASNVAAGGPAPSITSVSACMALSAGNYALTTNLAATGDCFTVASNVALDLKGHKLTGNGTGSGITDGGVTAANVTILNGTISGFVNGIKLTGTTGNGSINTTINKLTVTNNTGDGIVLNGTRQTHAITNTKVNNNGGNGITLNNNNYTGSVIQNVQANGNTKEGIFDTGCCSIMASVATQKNGTNGMEQDRDDNGFDKVNSSNNTGSGIVATGGACVCCNMLENVTAAKNGGDGIDIEGSSCHDDHVLDSVNASGNTGSGIHLKGQWNLTTNSVASNNGTNGIEVTDTNAIVANSVTNANTADGTSIVCPSNAVGVSAKGNGTNLAETGGTCTNLNNKTP